MTLNLCVIFIFHKHFHVINFIILNIDYILFLRVNIPNGDIFALFHCVKRLTI